ncbi:MAG: FlgO family outer membrane protein [Verrucomicrobiota bacterium]|nr:FlgO family outer membrane protein [Verrucomicrobiota bacterium]
MESHSRNGNSAENWQQLKSILAGALDRDPANREDYVAEACGGDAKLREEVEVLLGQDSRCVDLCAEDAVGRRDEGDDSTFIGSRIGAYRIDREIGRGGMGAVYLAERADGEFQKKVAIKLLKRGTDTDEVLRRFRVERQILARLEHPNIARLLDAGTSPEGLPFLVMEYVPGEPITYFCRTKALTIVNRLRLFLKVCKAVEFAHERHVIHRDLKPTNILVTADGEPKLLDFGIAKLVGPGDDLNERTLTSQQRFTPGCASPEQALGKPVTPASDVYALGALLYELLTEQNPHRFESTDHSPQEFARVIAEEEPQRPSQIVTDPRLRRSLRGDIENIVLVALRKEPARRYASVAELEADVEHYLAARPIKARPNAIGYRTRRFFVRKKALIGGAALLATLGIALGLIISRYSNAVRGQYLAAGTSEKSVAVLPFDPSDGDQMTSRIAKALQEEVLSDLAKVAELRVISRESVMSYTPAPTRDIREIARALNVSHVVEGSVRREGNKLHVAARLIDARNDASVWSETYDRDIGNVLVLENEIAKTIARRLRAEMSLSERAAIDEIPTTDAVAYDLYSQARELSRDVSDQNHSRKNLPEAVRLLNEAIARDPNFLLAYCDLARAHNNIYLQGIDHTPERLKLANAAIQEALALRPESGEAHLVLADYYYHGLRNYDRALAELEQARRHLPNDPRLYAYLGYIKRKQGRWAESNRALEKSVELDPRNFLTIHQLALSYEYERRYADVLRMYERALAVRPNDPVTLSFIPEIMLNWRAETKPLHETMPRLIAAHPDLASDLDVPKYALCERDPDVTARMLSHVPAEGEPESDVIYPAAWYEALVARAFEDLPKAYAAFEKARVQAEEQAAARPDSGAALSLVGMIDAGLGHKEEAIAEGRRACELLPISKDAIFGFDVTVNLALIYAWTGENNLALEQLAAAAAMPGDLSYGQLKLNPQWDSLRNDPRFEALVTSMAPR